MGNITFDFMKHSLVLCLIIAGYLSCSTSKNIEDEKAYLIWNRDSASTPDSIYLQKFPKKKVDEVLDSYRRVIGRDINLAVAATNALKSGIYTATVCIDNAGVVNFIKAEMDESDKTTSTQRKIWFESLQKYRFEASSKAPLIQCGKLTYSINSQTRQNGYRF
jgi:hypothetical protein